jgi:hypothetical protein
MRIFVIIVIKEVIINMSSINTVPSLEQQKKYFNEFLETRTWFMNAAAKVRSFAETVFGRFGYAAPKQGDSGVRGAWFNEIDDSAAEKKLNLKKKLYLGMIPNEDFIARKPEHMITENIRTVSILEPFEAECIDSSIKKNQKPDSVVNAIDNIGMLPATITKGVEALRKALSKADGVPLGSGDDELVYLHCKSGVGRSATVLAAYLIQECGYEFDEAIQFVQKNRPDAHLRGDNKHNRALRRWHIVESAPCGSIWKKAHPDQTASTKSGERDVPRLT